MELTETTLQKRYIYNGRIISVRCDDVSLPDGTISKREIVEHPGGASVLCIHGGCVVLVRQFRYAYGEVIYEIPAGKLEKGEDPVACAMRELSEETGFVAERLERLFTLYPTPGYTNEKLYIYLAHGVKEGKEHLDKEEFLNVERIPLENAYRMLESGEIRDAKTVAALLHYKSKNLQI